MKTWVVTFRFEYLKAVEPHINEYLRKRNLTPLSISMTTSAGIIFVAVVVTKNEESEDTE